MKSYGAFLQHKKTQLEGLHFLMTLSL